MADHNPREHAGAHGVHIQDLKPEHHTTVPKHEEPAAVEQESDSHDIHGKENHSHGKPIPLAKLRGPPTSQSSKGGQGPKPKPPGSGPKGTKPEAGSQSTEHDPESEGHKGSGHSDESHGGGEHTADKRDGRLRGKPAPPIIKGGSGGASGPPKGLKR